MSSEVVSNEPVVAPVAAKKPSRYMQYYKDNPAKYEKHLAYMREKVECECGAMISRTNMCAHKKHKIHATTMKNKKLQKFQKDLRKFVSFVGQLSDLKLSLGLQEITK
jgi:hypothetical protein